MKYLPLEFEDSNVFANKIIPLRNDVHIIYSKGPILNNTNRKTATKYPMVELAYNRKNIISGEIGNKLIELNSSSSSLGFFDKVKCESNYKEKQDIELYSIWIGPNSFSNFFQAVSSNDHLDFEYFKSGLYNCYNFEMDFNENSILKKLELYFRNEDNFKNKLLLESYILELISINIEKLLPQRNIKSTCINLSKSDIKSLEFACEILIDNLSNPPSILELSRIINMNDYKLKKSFKQYYNMTIYEFIRKKRFEKAFYLLESQQYNISQTAFKVGYTNVSHFSKEFRNRFGIDAKELIK